MIRRPPSRPRFPYTTLFRSRQRYRELARGIAELEGAGGRAVAAPELRAGDAVVGEEEDGIAERDRVGSEEHTSELQSQSKLVCRLLLEKKNRVYHRPLRHTP